MTQEGMYMFLQLNTDKVWGFPRCTTLNDPEFKWTWQMVVWLLEGHVLTFSSAELSSVSAVRGAENSSSGWSVRIQQGGRWQKSSLLPLQLSPWIHHFWLQKAARPFLCFHKWPQSPVNKNTPISNSAQMNTNKHKMKMKVAPRTECLFLLIDWY